MANNAINSDAQKLRCAPHLRAGYGEQGVSMGDWITIIVLSALVGFLCSGFLTGTAAWLTSALLPWFGVLAWLLYHEYFVPYQGGGASMWPIAQLFAGTVAAGVGLTVHAIFHSKWRF